MIRAKKRQEPRVCQGDIFREIPFIEYVSEKSGIIEVSKVLFPLVIVLTQDCDLEQDHSFRTSADPKMTQDKWLLSVIVAPLYNAEHVYNGEHLSELGLQMAHINKKRTEGDWLRQNERPRYHYLDFPPDIPIVNSVIDFKHYFTVHVEHMRDIKATNYICTVSELYRESISQRFANFLARIGLPEA